MSAPIGAPASGPAATSQIVTERLLLRRFEPHDLAEFARYRSDPDVARYQGWRPVSAIEHFIDAYNDRAQPIVWTKTPDHVLAKATKRQDTSDALH